MRPLTYADNSFQNHVRNLALTLYVTAKMVPALTIVPSIESDRLKAAVAPEMLWRKDGGILEGAFSVSVVVGMPIAVGWRLLASC